MKKPSLFILFLCMFYACTSVMAVDFSQTGMLITASNNHFNPDTSLKITTSVSFNNGLTYQSLPYGQSLLYNCPAAGIYYVVVKQERRFFGWIFNQWLGGVGVWGCTQHDTTYSAEVFIVGMSVTPQLVILPGRSCPDRALEVKLLVNGANGSTNLSAISNKIQLAIDTFKTTGVQANQWCKPGTHWYFVVYKTTYIDEAGKTRLVTKDLASGSFTVSDITMGTSFYLNEPQFTPEGSAGGKYTFNLYGGAWIYDPTNPYSYPQDSVKTTVEWKVNGITVHTSTHYTNAYSCTFSANFSYSVPYATMFNVTANVNSTYCGLSSWNTQYWQSKLVVTYPYYGSSYYPYYYPNTYYNPNKPKMINPDLALETNLKMLNNSVLKISFNRLPDSHSILTIYDMTGKVVKSIALGEISETELQFPFNDWGVEPGTYIIALLGTGIKESLKVLYQR